MGIFQLPTDLADYAVFLICERNYQLKYQFRIFIFPEETVKIPKSSISIFSF